MRGRPRLLPLAAATIVVAIDVLYASLIGKQGDGSGISSRVVFVAAMLGVAALAAVLGAFLRRGWLAVAALSISTSILAIWTILGAASIGLLIAVPALLALSSLTKAFDDESIGERWLALTLGIATVLATIVGLAST